MKIKLEDGVWLMELGDIEGDPPRTTLESEAYEFSTMAYAILALKEARKYRPFVNAAIT